MAPDTAAPRLCGEIVRRGSGDRYTHTYCDYLPAKHEGPHLDIRDPERMAKAWTERCIDTLTGLLDSLPTGHPEKPGVIRAIELLRSEA